MQTEIGNRIGSRVRQIRKHAGITQAELGERAGMAAAEICKIEKGKRTPTLETLEKLGEAMGVPLHEFVYLGREVSQRDALMEQVLLRLQGQPDELLRRVSAVIDALIRAG